MTHKEKATVIGLRDEIRLERHRLRQRLTEEARAEASGDAGNESSRPIRLAEVFRDLTS